MLLTIILATLILTTLILRLIGERARLLRPSTWETMQKGGLRSKLSLNALHTYIYEPLDVRLMAQEQVA